MNKRKKLVSLANKRAVCGYFFILPFLIGFVFLILSPFLLYMVMGFNKMTAGESGITLTNVGWKNYVDVLFNEPDFFQNVASSIGNLLITGICVIIFSFFMAVILNQKFHGRGIARAVFFLPVVIASGACALSQNDALSSSALAAITDISTSLGDGTGTSTLSTIFIDMLGVSFGDGFVEIIGQVLDQFYNIVMMSGVQILIFLAGLQGISPSLYEASQIDGATGWENFWKITFPLISPLILVNSVYTIVDYMGGASNSVINQLYKYSTEGSKYGLSSAMGTIYFAIVYVILGVVFVVMSRFVHYEER